MASGGPGRFVERLWKAAAADERFVVGLSSGTSFDGVDAALVRISGSGAALRAELIEFACLPYETDTRARVGGAPIATTPELARLHFELGEVFASAALLVIDRSGRSPADVDLIGSHGQTVFHEPPSGARRGVTLQIGEADIIARRTGVVTVSDFRTADIAAGGSGAPLIPLVDWLLFRKPGEPRLLLNVGGIANLTYVSDVLEELAAFDTGPGNSIMDEIVRAATGGRDSFDRDGARALSGEPRVEVVEEFLSRPYFRKAPPKSTGRELFGEEAARDLARAVHPGREIESLANDELNDLLATAAAVTAQSVRAGAALMPSASRVFVSGGGVHNRAIMIRLSKAFSPAPVASLLQLGMDPDAKEAVGFAVLASETICGRSGNVMAATGAVCPAVLGKVSPGL